MGNKIVSDESKTVKKKFSNLTKEIDQALSTIQKKTEIYNEDKNYTDGEDRFQVIPHTNYGLDNKNFTIINNPCKTDGQDDKK